MKVRMIDGLPKRAFARLEAFLAGVILTVSTAYAATICPMYWTQLQLEADMHNRLAIAQAVDRWVQQTGQWPADLAELAADPQFAGGGLPTNPLTGRRYRLDPTTHRVQ